MKHIRHVVLPAILFICFLAQPLFAQPAWMQPRKDNMLSFEWYKVATADENTDFITGTYFLGVKFELSPEMKLVGELPFSYVSGDLVTTTTQNGVVVNSTSQEFSKFLLGNVYAGLEIGSEERPVFFEMGLRIPTMEDTPDYPGLTASEDEYLDYLGYFSAMMIGLWSDIERYGAFMPLGVSGDSKYITAQALMNYQPELSESGLGFRLRGGPLFFLPTGDGNLEMALLYTGQGMFRTGPLYILGGITGLAPLTADDFDVSEDLAHHLILGLSADLNGVFPGVQFRAPLDSNGKDYFNSTIVFQVGVALK
jgi:hypothetical protein